MNGEFIPYEEALALKELGFDEPCFGWFMNSSEFYLCENGNLEDNNSAHRKPNYDKMYEEGVINALDLKEQYKNACSAPLYQQAFRFFREKYKLHQYVKQYYGERFYIQIDDMVHPRRFDEYPIERLRCFHEFTSQEEAELACLKILIKIVKTNG